MTKKKKVVDLNNYWDVLIVFIVGVFFGICLVGLVYFFAPSNSQDGIYSGSVAYAVSDGDCSWDDRNANISFTGPCHIAIDLIDIDVRWSILRDAEELAYIGARDSFVVDNLAEWCADLYARDVIDIEVVYD